MSMASQEDGGKAALAGFLYQILGFVGLKASVQCSRDYNKGDGLDVLIRVVRDGRTEHEASGQDVVIRSILEAGEGLTLVQFKYSWRFPPRPVYKAEYTTIVEKLAKSGLQAETDGKLVKGYFLVTNRRVPPKSKTGVVHRHKGKAGAKSKAPSVRKGRFEERLQSTNRCTKPTLFGDRSTSWTIFPATIGPRNLTNLPLDTVAKIAKCGKGSSDLSARLSLELSIRVKGRSRKRI